MYPDQEKSEGGDSFFLCLFDPWIRNMFFPDPFLTGPDLEKNEGGGWTEGVDEGWLRIRNRIGSGFNQFKCIRTRKRVVENDESWEVRWVGGWGRRRLDPN